MSKPFSLSKFERLKSKKEIDALFLHGEAFFVYPFKVCFQPIPFSTTAPLRIVVSAPKKIFKRAHQRNYVKRLIRECYRQQKHTLIHALQEKHQGMNLMIMYNQPEIPEYQKLYPKINLILQRLINHIHPPSGG